MSKTIFKLEWRPIVGDGTAWQLSLPYEKDLRNVPIAIAVRSNNVDWPWTVHTMPGDTGGKMLLWVKKPTAQEVLTIE